MGRSEEIARFIDGAGGVVSAAQIKGAGFLPGSISHALKSGVIDKLTRGIYCLPEVFDDEFTAVTYRWRKCVISHGSALYLAGLSDRMPYVLDVTVPHGYNPHGLSVEYPDVRIHRVNQDIYELGITEVKSPGGAMVRAYCAQRAVADLISQRGSEGVDPQLVRDAVAGYFRRSDADIEGLARMCSALGVEDEFRMYLEVLR
ncbi:type IV toxin-antitoxin system AbiEi family antitoxin domain-containing protein [Schaalia sp. ZJ1691]|uniref:type IV toxin-antitoxin system AbiEi family antitoxin domain-containing protein n=1 Tax=Schaalia sp. ZJ1691 TaxID=2709404 RepID=UPI0013EB169A|nr:type IV toxin-antitoxin system AbiEi family antitoxin domain-containing protein [Schaalia sp. ZJ1691]